MHLLVHHKLSKKQKWLLTYRGLPTFFVLFSLFLTLILVINIFQNYTNTTINTLPLKKDTTAISNTYNTQNIAQQIHLKEIEQRKKTTSKTTPPFFSFLLFLAPLYFLRKHYLKGKEIGFILSNGIITTAKIINNKITKTRTFTIHTLTFEYYTNDNPKKKILHQKSTRFAQKFLDENEELIIYHKTKPALAILVDDLPTSISIHIKHNWL